ncbi:hypothetical protein N2605_29935 [Bradyrhizobium yuanmingense]|uniref:hypothetical protein n=1 Tax=Bradyrhizobium yuanmingense TaxID=108015 RepID=UPI0021A6DAF6|nr:hypothetical protein [Bradyrhizobium sp. CB1024]UWU83692.1 hypothetical protein N2605_29935 [Bradyrhizobium sp. CB1024]
MRTDETSQSLAAAAIGFAVTVQRAATRRKVGMRFDALDEIRERLAIEYRTGATKPSANKSRISRQELPFATPRPQGFTSASVVALSTNILDCVACSA